MSWLRAVKNVLLSGSSNPALASEIAEELSLRPAGAQFTEFPNGELRLRVCGDLEGTNALLLQSTHRPAERGIVELGLLADAARRKGAERVVAIIPWFGYAAQDKSFREGEPLSSRVVVRMLESTEIDEFIIVDIHS